MDDQHVREERVRQSFGFPRKEPDIVPEFTAEEARRRWVVQRVEDIEARMKKGATLDEAFEQLRKERYAGEVADESEREVLQRRAVVLERKLLEVQIAAMQKNPSRYPRGQRKAAIARLRKLEKS